MPVLDLDRLFLLAHAAPLFEDIERELLPHRLEITYLHKLQEDAGVQIDREVNGSDPDAPAPGRQSAALVRGFTPVTDARLGILAQAHDILSAKFDKKGIANPLPAQLAELMQKLNAAAPSLEKRSIMLPALTP